MWTWKFLGRELEIKAGLGGRAGAEGKERKGMKESSIPSFVRNTDMLGLVLGAGYTDIGRMPRTCG